MAFENLTVDFTFESDNWNNDDKFTDEVESVLAVAIKHLKLDVKSKSEISIVLSNNQAVRELNQQWRGQDKSTNVLSFPVQQITADKNPFSMLGDIIFAYETIRDEAKEMKITFQTHFTHLLVHGLLHLLGYNHETEAEALIMETMEVHILADLGVENPYNRC